MRKVILNISSAKVVNTNIDLSIPRESPYKNKKYRETFGRDNKSVENINDMDNIIHINHIINALHVMLGARPVSFKYGDRNRLSNKIVNIVENGIIRYDNVYKGEITCKNGDTKTVFNNEFTQGKKIAGNSNRQGLLTTATNGETYNFLFTWSSLNKKMYYSPQYKEVYNNIINFSEKKGLKNVKKNYSLIDLIILLRDNYEDFSQQFNNINDISPLIKILNKNPGNGSFNQIESMSSSNLAGLGNVNAPTPKVSVNATIILFMDDEDAENLLSGKRYATILDNGFIYIANNEDNNIINNVRDFNVVDDIDEYIEDYLDEGFVKINELPYTNGKTEN